MRPFPWNSLSRLLSKAHNWTGAQTFSSVVITGGTISGVTATDNFTTSVDPASNAAVTTAIVNAYNGVLITLTTTGVAQTLQAPTAATIKRFTVINNDTSTNTITVNGITIPVGKGQVFLYDGSAWGPTDLGITAIPVSVNQGGTGQSTAETALAALAAGNTRLGGLTALGTSADKVVGLASGTAPTTSPADAAQFVVVDRQGVAGKAAWHMRNEEGQYAPVAFANLTYRTSAGNVTMGVNEIGNNYLEVSATGTVILPAVPNIAQTSNGSLVGAVITIYSTTAAVISVDPNAADRIVMDGTAQTDGEQITCDAIAGNSVTLICDSVAGWRVLGKTGIWINGG
jgi:hypothetical protein